MENKGLKIKTFVIELNKALFELFYHLEESICLTSSLSNIQRSAADSFVCAASVDSDLIAICLKCHPLTHSCKDGGSNFT